MIRWTTNPISRKKLSYQTERVGAYQVQREIVYKMELFAKRPRCVIRCHVHTFTSIIAVTDVCVLCFNGIIFRYIIYNFVINRSTEFYQFYSKFQRVSKQFKKKKSGNLCVIWMSKKYSLRLCVRACVNIYWPSQRTSSLEKTLCNMIRNITAVLHCYSVLTAYFEWY